MGKRLAKIIALGIPAIALVWCASWYALSAYAKNRIDAFMAAEKNKGREYQCARLNIGGFPFSLTVGCETLKISARSKGEPVEVELAGVQGEFRLLRPGYAEASLIAPMNIHGINGRIAVRSQWESKQLRLGLQGFSPTVLRITARNLSVDSLQGGAPQREFEAATVLAVFELRGGEFGPSNDLNIRLQAGGALLPVLDSFVEDQSPASINAIARVNRLAAILTPANNLAERVEAWRTTGGTLNIRNFLLEKQNFQFAGSGEFTANQQGFLEGSMQIGASGISSLMRRFGLPAGSFALENILNRRPRGSRGDATSGNRPPMLPVPVVFRNGRVFLGPVSTRLSAPRLY